MFTNCEFACKLSGTLLLKSHGSDFFSERRGGRFQLLKSTGPAGEIALVHQRLNEAASHELQMSTIQAAAQPLQIKPPIILLHSGYGAFPPLRGRI